MNLPTTIALLWGIIRYLRSKALPLQVIPASPAQAGTLVPSLVTALGANIHYSLQLTAHDLPPKSRVETQVKIRLEFSNMPVTSPGADATAGPTTRWRWLRLPFTASVKQPRFYDHGMRVIIIPALCVSRPFKRPLRPTHCYTYTLLRFALVNHTSQPLAAQPVTGGKPNVDLSTTRSQQTPILPPALSTSHVNPYSTCQVVVSICRSVRAFPYMNIPK